MGLSHYVLAYIGDLHLVHPELNLSILDAGILIIVFVTNKFYDGLLEHVGLPHVLSTTVHLFFSAVPVEGLILSHIYSLGFIFIDILHA